MRLGDSNQLFNIETVSTGALSLNLALEAGGGGIQRTDHRSLWVQNLLVKQH